MEKIETIESVIDYFIIGIATCLLVAFLLLMYAKKNSRILIWVALNGIQLVVYVPLMRCVLPANVGLLSKRLSNWLRIDLPLVEKFGLSSPQNIVNYLFELPASKSPSLNQ